MNETMKVTRKQVAPIIDASFPEYKGRKIRIEFTGCLSFYNTNWGDGSRNEYRAVSRDGRTARYDAPAPWVNAVEGQSMNMASGNVIVVMHSIFCGQDMGITIYAHPSLAPKLLTA